MDNKKMVDYTTDASFDRDKNSNTILLVDFWAEWCGPCKMLTPIIEEIAKEFEGRIKVMKMNIDENPNIASLLGIRSIPTLILFKEGRSLSTKVGASPRRVLSDWIKENIE